MPILPVEAVQPAIQAQQILQIQEMNATTPTADPAAVAKFQAAMAATEAQPVSSAAAPTEATPPVQAPFLGEFEDAFVSAERQNRQLYRNVESLLVSTGTGGFTPAEIMALQYQVANLSFQQEVVTKVVDKVSTAIQTLVKNQ